MKFPTRGNYQFTSPMLLLAKTCMTSMFSDGVKIFLAHPIRKSEILHWDRKSYLTNAILPRTSSNVFM